MNKKVGILVFLFVFLGLAGGLVLVRQQQETRRQAAGDTAVLQILPSEQNVEAGETVSAQIRLSVGENKVSAFDLKLNFNPDKLSIIDLVGNQDLFPNKLIEEIDNQAGFVKLGYANFIPDDWASGDGLKIADITIQVAESGAIDFDPEYVHEVVGADSSGESIQFELDLAGAGYSVAGDEPAATATKVPQASPTQAPTATQVPTATQAPTAVPPKQDDDTLTFLVTIVGVDDSRAVAYNPAVDVIIKQGHNLVQEVKNVSLQPAEGAKFQGEIALSQLGSGYSVYIKGNRHLSRKFCQNNQQSRCDGPGNIQLAGGDNLYDFSGLVLEAGDVPHPTKGQTDTVGALDFSYVKSQLGTSGESPADVDYNGVVNGRDIVFILQTLSTKHGEL